MKEYINEALEKYIEKGTYPWHMPGHKRQPIEAVQNVDNISKSRENFWNGVYAHDLRLKILTTCMSRRCS